MLNRLQLIGNLGKDPEKKETKSEVTIVTLQVATTRRVKKDDKWEDETEWHRVTVFGNAAGNCLKYLSKGSKVYIEARLKTRSYEQDGQKKYVTEIIAEDVKFLSAKSESGSSEEPSSAKTSNSKKGNENTRPTRNEPTDYGYDEDIPF